MLTLLDKYFMDYIAEASKILKQPIGWIELDLKFDLKKWKEEALLIKNYLVPHREGDGHKGWKSCCLHGVGIDITGTDDTMLESSYKWTALVDICPTITTFWKLFPTEKFKRIRFMEVEPHGFISPHADGPGGIKNTEFNMMDHMIPINVAIMHPTDCVMDLKNYGRVPWEEGKIFIVNITDTHSVTNNSNEFRMHMIAHCVLGNQKEKFAKLIVDSYYKNTHPF